MSETWKRALDNAAASSAMEGLPIDREKRAVIEQIISGKFTLQQYFQQLQKLERGA